MHHLFVNRSLYPHLTLEIDAASQFFLNLWECKGPTFMLRGKGPFSYCFEKAFDPLQHVSIEPSKTSLTRRNSSTLRFTNARGDYEWPFLVHANGYHHRLLNNKRRPILWRPLLSSLDQTPPEVLNHPVLLFDSNSAKACNVTTVEHLLLHGPR
mmetsp:Transcript_45315/g.75071  ORF Transcript_45315/g.75071 Transcript_45315/m.75071 type:complete len:154 (+) Transcript_45315:190-651(+)